MSGPPAWCGGGVEVGNLGAVPAVEKPVIGDVMAGVYAVPSTKAEQVCPFTMLPEPVSTWIASVWMALDRWPAPGPSPSPSVPPTVPPPPPAPPPGAAPTGGVSVNGPGPAQ